MNLKISLFAFILFLSSIGIGMCNFDENSIYGTIIDNTPPPQPKVFKRDLLENRQKRNVNKYQQAPANTSNVRELKVRVSSYCIGGMTSRGVQTRVGVIAVDPNIIPYGSKIYVPGYGWGTALDTGGSIKGNTIDIWMPTYGQCMQWGVRNLTIKVVKP